MSETVLLYIYYTVVILATAYLLMRINLYLMSLDSFRSILGRRHPDQDRFLADLQNLEPGVYHFPQFEGPDGIDSDHVEKRTPSPSGHLILASQPPVESWVNGVQFTVQLFLLLLIFGLGWMLGYTAEQSSSTAIISIFVTGPYYLLTALAWLFSSPSKVVAALMLQSVVLMLITAGFAALLWLFVLGHPIS